MKKNIKYILLALIGIAFAACTDDNDGPFIKDGDNTTGETSISLIAPESGGSYILREETADKTWETFSWTSPNDVAVGPSEYYVEVNTKDSELEPILVGPYAAQPVEVSEAALNTALVTLGITEPNTKVDVLTRVKQTVGTRIEYYSAKVTSSVIVYGGSTEKPGIPVLYVPGGHQGWDPANTYQVYSMDNDGIYKGYVNFPAGGEEFKFTAQANWDGPNYGDAGATSGLSGALSDDSGAGNLKLGSTAGSYLLTANITDMTWTAEAKAWEATANSWGLIGDATPGGWDNDTDMTFNASNGLLELNNITLTDGEIKFRANDGWDLNYGDTKVDDAVDGIADNGGDNIAVTAGTYNITLDMRNPAQITYKVEVKE
ncbi:MAG: SusE domain-containing protein [Bacteroidales bacterium]